MGGGAGCELCDRRTGLRRHPDHPRALVDQLHGCLMERRSRRRGGGTGRLGRGRPGGRVDRGPDGRRSYRSDLRAIDGSGSVARHPGRSGAVGDPPRPEDDPGNARNVAVNGPGHAIDHRDRGCRRARPGVVRDETAVRQDHRGDQGASPGERTRRSTRDTRRLGRGGTRDSDRRSGRRGSGAPRCCARVSETSTGWS